MGSLVAFDMLKRKEKYSLLVIIHSQHQLTQTLKNELDIDVNVSLMFT